MGPKLGLLAWLAVKRIDDRLLEDHAEEEDSERDRKQDGKTERQVEPLHSGKREEGGQHDKFALGEIDALRRLPEQREANRRKGVDGAGGQAGDQQLEKVGHGCSMSG